MTESWVIFQERNIFMSSGPEVKSGQRLFFEQVFEGLAGIERTTGSRFRNGGGDLRRLLIGGGSGVFFDGCAEFIKLAIIFAVFGSDAFWNRLRAFKLRARIEEAALFAAVEFGIALGTGALGIEAGSENGSAIGATGARDGANHAGSARAEMIILSAGTALRRFTFRA